MDAKEQRRRPFNLHRQVGNLLGMLALADFPRLGQNPEIRRVPRRRPQRRTAKARYPLGKRPAIGRYVSAGEWAAARGLCRR